MARPVAPQLLQCQWCGEDFPEPKPTKGDRTAPRSRILIHADHEVKCEKNPNRPPKQSQSKAWTPSPYKPSVGGAQPVPVPTLLTFAGGPWSGRRTAWEQHLVDGSTAVIEPPRIVAGPVKPDSRDRACSVYMGHYELRITDGCPVYRWVDTIVPKKRLGQPTEFTAAWPELAASLEEEEDARPTESHDRSETGPAGGVGPEPGTEPERSDPGGA